MATQKNAGSRRIMHELQIQEISAVDRPAQKGARATIMKRADDNDVNKQGGDFVDTATGETEGHQHGIRFMRGENGSLGMILSYAKGPNELMETHDHQVIQNQDGSFEVTTNHGHTHSIDMDALQASALSFMTKNEEGSEIVWVPGDQVASLGKATSEATEETTEGETEMSKELEAQITELTKNADRANAVIGLSPDVRKHFDTLEASAQDTFLALTGAEQSADITKMADANAVIYKASNGDEFTKNDDPRLITMATAADASAKELAIAKAATADADLTKRAEALVHIPGDVDVRKSILKSIDGITDEADRGKALDALKAQDLALGKAHNVLGTVEKGEANGDETAQLDTMAKAYAKEHSVTEAVAYGKVLDTSEGKALYAKSVQ